MAGAGAAAATAGVAIAANTGSVGAAPAQDSTEAAATAGGPLVAYVQNTRSGQVSVMVGESEVVVSDPALVARLASIASGKKA
jgi:hypothetical protein